MATAERADRIKGVLSPVVTPFKADLSPDPERFIRQCRWLVSQDVGLAVFGTNSEANSLSTEEKLEILTAEAPELLALVQDFRAKITAMRERVFPLIQRCGSPNHFLSRRTCFILDYAIKIIINYYFFFFFFFLSRV